MKLGIVTGMQFEADIARQAADTTNLSLRGEPGAAQRDTAIQRGDPRIKNCFTPPGFAMTDRY